MARVDSANLLALMQTTLKDRKPAKAEICSEASKLNQTRIAPPPDLHVDICIGAGRMSRHTKHHYWQEERRTLKHA